MIKAKIKLLLHSISGFRTISLLFFPFLKLELYVQTKTKRIFFFLQKESTTKSEGIVLDIRRKYWNNDRSYCSEY